MNVFKENIRTLFTTLGCLSAHFLECVDSSFYTLLVFIVIDYITGVMVAIVNHTLSSRIGYKGIFQKLVIFMLVGLANLLDTTILKNGNILKTTVTFFYIFNEGISLLENATKLGLPIPEKFKSILKEIKDSTSK